MPEFEPYLESGMIGYGRFHYRYPCGREGDWFRVGLASRKQASSPAPSGWTKENSNV
ncbi:MAG: hypothetical protein ACRDKA_06720 [Actinomycetota bacterium]